MAQQNIIMSALALVLMSLLVIYGYFSICLISQARESRVRLEKVLAHSADHSCCFVVVICQKTRHVVVLYKQSSQ